MDVTSKKKTALTISYLSRAVLYSSLIVPIVLQLTPTWTLSPSDFIKNFNESSQLARQLATWQLKEGLKETEQQNFWMAVEKTRKEKRKFERKRKGYKLCREEMDVTDELKIKELLL